MRKSIAIVMAIIMLILCSCADNSVNNSDEKSELIVKYVEQAVTIDNVESAEFAVDGDFNVYFGGETLMRTSLNGEQTEICDDIGFIYSIFYHDGYIYGYAPLENSVIRVNAETGSKETVADFVCNNAIGLCVCRGYVYVIAEPHSELKTQSSPTLFRINIKDGSCEQVSDDNVSCLYVSESGRVFCYVFDGNKSAVYELSDSSMTPVFKTGDIGDMFSFVYENRTLYYASVSGDIKKLNADGEVSVFVYEANAVTNGSMGFVKGNLIYLDTDRRSIRSKYILGKDLYSVVTINDEYSGKSGASNSILKIGKIPELTGIPCNIKGYSSSEVILKIMAGDSDVDIYFINGTEARQLIEKGMYTPIRSEVISRHNSSCFDYLSDFCKTNSGDMALMPLTSSICGVLMPKSAVSELSVEKDSVAYIDNYLNLVRSYTGERKAYTTSDNLYSFLNYQYEKYYCDFKNGVFDYNTDEYRRLYKELLSGYQRYEENAATVNGFLRANSAKKTDTDSILVIDDNFCNYAAHSDEWRAFPIPRISEQVDANFVNAVFAYINPYSENKEAAIMVLESIAENYDSLANGSAYEAFRYPFIKKDKSDYGQRYHTDSELFNDFYEIAANGFVHEYQIMSSRNDIDEYQSGRLSIDDAIAMYQREVDIWLNE